MRAATVDAPQARSLAVARPLARHASAVVGGFACAITATLGLMHGGYFSTAWGWGSLACLWIALVTLLVSDRLELGRLEIVVIGLLAAFLAWTAASETWSVAAPAAIRELERGLLLLSALVAAMLLVRHHMRPVLGGVLGGITIACGYGLATRLFPSHLGGAFDAIAGYRLDEPLGYWNAVGLFAAMGTLLAIGFAARGRTILARAFGSAAPIILVPTLYFTFSRGAWAALAIGLAVAVAIDRRRLQLLATSLALSPLVALAVWFCAREPDLNRRAAALGGAVTEGRRLAFILVGLTVAAAFVGPAVQLAERRVRIGRRVRLAYGGLLVLALLVAVGAGLVHYGGPQHVASRAYDSFKARPISVSNSGNLNKRLFSLSGSGRLTQWRVAVDDYRAHPWLGSGAGTYELSWLHDRPTGSWKIRDAHNLYVEVLAELGPVGLALLLLTLSVPIYAAVKVRRHPLVPIALGAYVAFLTSRRGRLGLGNARADDRRSALRCRDHGCCTIQPRGTTADEARSDRCGHRHCGSCGLCIRRPDGQPRNRCKQQRRERFQLERVREPRAVTRSAGCPGRRMPWRLQGEAQYVQGNFDAARANFRQGDRQGSEQLAPLGRSRHGRHSRNLARAGETSSRS